VPGSKREKEKKMKREREREGRKESLVVASSAPLWKAHERSKRSKAAAAATHARLARMALLLAFAWPGGRDDDGWTDGRMDDDG
jgi:hypothetical protein